MVFSTLHPVAIAHYRRWNNRKPAHYMRCTPTVDMLASGKHESANDGRECLGAQDSCVGSNSFWSDYFKGIAGFSAGWGSGDYSRDCEKGLHEA